MVINRCHFFEISTKTYIVALHQNCLGEAFSVKGHMTSLVVRKSEFTHYSF